MYPPGVGPVDEQIKRILAGVANPVGNIINQNERRYDDEPYTPQNPQTSPIDEVYGPLTEGDTPYHRQYDDVDLSKYQAGDSGPTPEQSQDYSDPSSAEGDVGKQFANVATKAKTGKAADYDPMFDDGREGNTKYQQRTSDRFGIGSTGPAAEAAAETAKGYIPDIYEGSRQSGGGYRTMPQQFGQEGTPYTGDERPLTPQEAADKYGAENYDDATTEKNIRQHTLGYGLSGQRGRQQQYANYVAKSRAQADADKQAQLGRAIRNRADIADRDARTSDQMANYNNMISGGTAFGREEPNVPRVDRVGGLTFVRGRYRPLTEPEAAQVDLHKANAEYLRQKPDIAFAGMENRNNIEANKNAIRVMIANGQLNGKIGEAILRHMDSMARTNVIAEGNEETARHHRANERHSQATLASINDYRKAIATGVLGKDQRAKDDMFNKNLQQADQLMKIVAAQEAAGNQRTWGGMGAPDPEAANSVYDPAKGILTNKRIPGEHEQRVADLIAHIKIMQKLNPNYQVGGALRDFVEKHAEDFRRNPEPELPLEGGFNA